MEMIHKGSTIYTPGVLGSTKAIANKIDKSVFQPFFVLGPVAEIEKGQESGQPKLRESQQQPPAVQHFPPNPSFRNQHSFLLLYYYNMDNQGRFSIKNIDGMTTSCYINNDNHYH